MHSAIALFTSIYDALPLPFLHAFQDTFKYLGMEFGGYVHANCRQGYVATDYEADVETFMQRVRVYRP